VSIIAPPREMSVPEILALPDLLLTSSASNLKDEVYFFLREDEVYYCELICIFI
jgi:hypothetical protein